jgi:hypothetical protein
MNRHGRQSRLAEVGRAGQERIAAGAVDVPLRGLAGEVAIRYLAGAGVGTLHVREPALVAVATSVDPAVRVEVRPGPSAPQAAGASDATCETQDDPAGDLRDPAAREVARGARVALRALRALIEVPS